MQLDMKVFRNFARISVYALAILSGFLWISTLLSLLAMRLATSFAECQRQEVGLACSSDILTLAVNYWLKALLFLFVPPTDAWLPLWAALWLGNVLLLVRLLSAIARYLVRIIK